jgi:RND family efflux transporter MFP subunit
MKSKRIATIVVLSLVGLIVALIAVRFATIKRRAAAASIEEIQAAEGIPVDVQVVRKRPIAQYNELLGTVEGIEQVQITSSLPIDVTGIAKREGDPVRKGDVIIRLARDRRGKAFHQYATLKQALDNAKSDLERTENLHREGAVSGQALEQARLAYENAKAQYDEAASVVDLVSPIDGIVTMVNATVGSEAIPGAPLATVAEIDRMRVRCWVGHNEIAAMQTGQMAYVDSPVGASATASRDSSAAAGAGSPGIEGEITRVSLSSDPATKLYLVEVTCGNAGGELRPGMVATVRVLVGENANALPIPSDAVIRRDDKSYVYRARSNRAVFTEVSLGADSGDFIDVTRGISDGDTVVVRGQFRLTDNARVRIRATEGMK